MSNGVMVDLDQASFGYQVGEIEILVSSFEEVAVAKETIRKTAKLLGVEKETTIPGKIEAYLSQHCRSHYEQLVGNGCFINVEALNKSG